MKFPQFDQEIAISYFSDVKNAGQIRNELLSGNPDYQVAFINANTLLSSKHLLAAVYRAVSDQEAGSMKTKTYTQRCCSVWEGITTSWTL